MGVSTDQESDHWVSSQTLPLASCVTLGNFPNLSVPQLPSLNNISAYLIGFRIKCHNILSTVSLVPKTPSGT